MGVLDGERYLRTAVESVLTRNFPDFEFLIVDDASADTTRQILDSFSDDRIQIVTNPHTLGLTRSLNVGLAAARGAYVARMDADDVTLPGRFEQQVTFLDANPERAMVASFVEHIDADGASLGVVRSPVEQGEIVRSLRQGNCFAHGPSCSGATGPKHSAATTRRWSIHRTTICGCRCSRSIGSPVFPKSSTAGASTR